MPPAHDVDQKIPAKFLREFEVKRIIIVDKKKKNCDRARPKMTCGTSVFHRRKQGESRSALRTDSPKPSSAAPKTENIKGILEGQGIGKDCPIPR